MKALVILTVLVLVAALLRWMSFSNSADNATISIDKQKVQQDTSAAVESVKEAVDDVQERFDDNPPETAAPHEDKSLPSTTSEETVPPNSP